MYLEIGQTYKVNHARKGQFSMRVDALDDEIAHLPKRTPEPKTDEHD